TIMNRMTHYADGVPIDSHNKQACHRHRRGLANQSLSTSCSHLALYSSIIPSSLATSTGPTTMTVTSEFSENDRMSILDEPKMPTSLSIVNSLECNTSGSGYR